MHELPNSGRTSKFGPDKFINIVKYIIHREKEINKVLFFVLLLYPVCNHDKFLTPIAMMRGKLRIIENQIYPKRGIIENRYTPNGVYMIFNIPRLGYM